MVLVVTHNLAKVKLRVRFPLPAPEFCNIMSDLIYKKNLSIVNEKFERIGKTIELFWGHKEFPEYVNRLLSDNTAVRKGFPSDVLMALISLQSLHDKMFPEHRIDEPDNWLSSQFGVR